MRFVFLLLFLLQIVSTADAQIATHSIRGIVTDSTGAVVPDATVSLRKSDSSTETKQSLILNIKTDFAGNFIFKNLLPDAYTLIITAPDIGTETEKQVLIPRDKTVEVSVKVEIGSGCNRISDDLGTVTDADKALIAKMAFENAFITNSALLGKEQKDSVVVSTRNIKPEWLRDITGLKIELISQGRIQNLANSSEDFPYISFLKFDVKGSCVAVEVANIWAVGKKSTTLYLSGGGETYEFRRESGKWNRKFISGWIS